MGLIDRFLGKRVDLDTMFFNPTLEYFPPIAAAIARLAALIGAREVEAFTCELALAEALVVPYRRGDSRLITLSQDFIRSRDGLTVSPVTRGDFLAAAAERAGSSLKLPDAVHLAVARRHRCDAFVTNDLDFARLTGMGVLFLNDPAFP